jgi:hypothetical protein
MGAEALSTLPRHARERVGRFLVATELEPLLRVGYGLAIAAVLLQTTAHLVNAYGFDGAYHSLDAGAGGEGNALTWASSSATFAAGMFALLLAVTDPARRLVFGALAGILTFFSLDDSVTLHERMALELVAALGLDDGWARTAWPVVLLPLLAFVSIVLWRVAVSASEAQRRALRTGLGLLVFAVVIEVLLVAVPSGSAAWELLEPAEVALEEAAELAGWIVIAAGLAAVFAGRVSTAVPDTAGSSHT